MDTMSQQASRLRELRTQYDRVKADADVLKKELEHAELQLFERMEHEDVGSLKVGSVNFVRASTTYGQIQDRSAFVDWAQEEMPELLELKERRALVSEIVRERLDTGQEMPPGLGFYQKQYVAQRVAK